MLTEEQTMLQEMLARFLASPPENIWQRLAELGVIGALFNESNGGFGGSGTDIALVFEQIGRNANPIPLIDCALIPGYLLAAAGKDLTPLINAESHYTIAHTETGARYDLQSVATKFANGTVTGHKTLVFGTEQAGKIIVSARDDQTVNLYTVQADAPGILNKRYQLAQGGTAADVTFSSVPAEPLLHKAMPALETAWAAAVVAQSADTLGAMECAAAMTQDYLKTREQFGRPLSSFQALAHRVTDMMLSMEQARSAVSLAATHLHDPAPTRDLHCAACKNLMGRMGRMVAEESVQLHGGIGMTQEYALGNYVQRIIMAEHRFGDSDHHMERFIQLSGYNETVS